MDTRARETQAPTRSAKRLAFLLCGFFSVVSSKINFESHFDQIFTQDVNKEIYEDYLAYYSEIPGPLKELTASNPMQAYLYAKIAEEVIQQYNDKHQVVYRLRGIVSCKKMNKTLVSFTLRLQSNYGGDLLEGRFHVRLSYQNKTQSFALLSSAVLPLPSNATCDQISTAANCTKCNKYGRCLKGKVPIDLWLKFAIKTQRLIQIDQHFYQVQFFAAHNAFNNRADGYGVGDDCPWPPPYNHECYSLANQEFTMTDILNMGYHSLEIDPDYCFNEMRMSHCRGRALGCAPVDRLFVDGIQEIGQWVHKPENQGKVIRLYLEDGPLHTEGHDDLINGPIQQFLGDKVFTPTDKKNIFGNSWPTIRQLIEINKTVVFSTNGNTTHGAKFVHPMYWREYIEHLFTPYPDCGGKTSSNVRRFFCDSTNYGPFWNGPKETGVIRNFTEFVKCRIQYPAADQVDPSLLKTGVFTWAEGQPATPLTNSSCVLLDGNLHRWKVSDDCENQLYSACVSIVNNEKWTISVTPSAYGLQTDCPNRFVFGLPVNGYQQQKIVEAAGNHSVWINLSPYISLLLGQGT